MQKESKDPRWPGYVVLPSYMSFPMLGQWEKGMADAKMAGEGDVTSEFFHKLLKPVLFIVKEWHIEGLPDKVDEDTFPASHKFIGWLIDEVSDLYTRTNEPDPLEQERP